MSKVNKQGKCIRLGTAANLKILFTLITAFFLIALTRSPSLADPFMSYPGARAKALGGAFTGIADDASAAWYNPAGLAGETHNLTLEWSQAVTRDKEGGSLKAGSSAWFTGGQISYDEFGIGLFYYPPYTVKYWASDLNPGINNVAWGKVDEIIQTVSLPFSVSTFDGSLKIGGSLDWVHIGIDGSKIYLRDSGGNAKRYSIAKEGDNGFSGSIGALFTYFDNEPWPYKMRFGGTYRLKSSSDIGAAAMQADSDQAVARLFFDKPASYDLGLSLMREFTSIGSTLLFATQYGSTDWGGAQKDGQKVSYGQISFGLEFDIIRENALLKKTSFRIGYYTSGPSAQSKTESWRPDVKGITYGIGFLMGDYLDNLRMDIAQEQKSFDNSDGFNDTATLSSLALTWLF